ncbi:MAG: PAS domain-containing hybrid sensor histidine kinase/response regulator [Chitinivibrionales bacterium]
MVLDSSRKENFLNSLGVLKAHLSRMYEMCSSENPQKDTPETLLAPLLDSFHASIDSLEQQKKDLKKQNEMLRADIASVKLAEQALKESEQKFRALAQTAHEAIVSADCSGTIAFWNRGAELMFGYKSHEIIGKHISALVPDGTFDSLSEVLQETIIEEGENSGARLIEALAKRKDCSVFPTEISLSSWQSGDTLFHTATIREVTRRKQTEDDLAREKQLLDVTLRSTGDGIISTDTSGRILLINGVAEAITGVSSKEVIGKNINDIFQPQDAGTFQKTAGPTQKVVTEGETVDGEVILTVGRSRRRITYLASPMRDSSGQIIGMVLALQDITERRRMEEELFRTRKLEAIGVLAGGIAHDFNNILTGIITNLFMVKTGLKTGSDPYKLITDAEKAAFQASKLTKQLMTFAKGGAPVKENASISELIEDSVGFCLSGSSIECELQLDADLWGVEIDRGQIDQVLNNLLINAKQAMPRGGTVVVRAENMEIEDKLSDVTEAIIPLLPGKYLKITITDEGVGISRDNLSRIFDPYFTTSSKRNGLGLSTVYSIIRKHNGLITAKSRLGKGTKFIFYLPARRHEQKEIAEHIPRCHGNKRILVMDDDEIIRVVVDRILKNAGYQVETVTNGFDALHLYKSSMRQKRPFDLVLMDITVPGGMGGEKAIKKLLSIDPHAKVIASSGYSNDPIMTNYRAHGFVDVLPKPFNVAEFMQVIARFTEEK